MEPLILIDELPFHRQIKLKRVHDGFTLAELAVVIGCCTTTLSEVENNRRRLPYKYLERMKNYLYREMYSEKQFVGHVDQYE